MNRVSACAVQFSHTVNRVAYYVHQSTFDLITYWHCYRTTQRSYFHASLQIVGAVHRYRTNGVFTDVLLYLHNQAFAVVSLYFECIMNGWKNRFCFSSFEIYINHRSDDLGNMSDNL